MRRTLWRVVSLVFVVGLALIACSGPNRSQQPSSASGFNVTLETTTNSLRAIPPGSDADLGACTVATAKVFDTNGRLVDGAVVFFSTTLGTYREGTQDFGGVVRTTVRGIATAFFCAKKDRGTAILTATVEDAVASTTVTIF